MPRARRRSRDCSDVPVTQAGNHGTSATESTIPHGGNAVAIGISGLYRFALDAYWTWG
ncbi:hypothetical protein [Halorhabdus rudnickae]|uniref:hypothetical protein n=1 Tax=Halorhabdus rudnickae TaxID=1775544 RepID=UPI001AF007CA|nr:hypothetical protein [Halorhabdus rudnickae]